MSDDYAALEAACEKIMAENALLREGFSEWLRSKGLSERTVERHDSNVRVYTDDYLLYQDAIEAAQGTSKLEKFFGYWFIKKCLWASPTSMRGIAASLKKFYSYMRDSELITPEALKELKENIKYGLPDWLETLQRYDDPTQEVWGL